MNDARSLRAALGSWQRPDASATHDRVPHPGGPAARRSVALAAALLAVLAACAPASPRPASPPTEAPSSPVAAAAAAPTAGGSAPGPGPATGPSGAPAKPAGEGPAPDFTARLLGGGAFTFAQQRGKPIVVLFTASWCNPCIPEVDKMARLQEEFGAAGLQQLVLSLDPGDTEADFAGFRQKTKGQNLLWGLDPGQKATLAYRVRAADTKVWIDRQGQIQARTVGSTPFEVMRANTASIAR